MKHESQTELELPVTAGAVPVVVECAGADLHATLDRLEREGLHCYRLDVVGVSAWRLHLRAARRQEASQFKPGNEQSARGGLAKAGKLPVTQDSESPAETKRDRKKSNAQSTAGQLAGTTTYNP